MKVELIPDRCIACGLCQTYSDHFDYDDDGIVIFAQSEKLVAEFPESPDVLLAAKSCPTKAILTSR